MSTDPAALPVEVPGVTVRYAIDDRLHPILRAVLNHPAETVVRRPTAKKDTTVKIAKTTLTLTLAAAMALGMSACSFEEPTISEAPAVEVTERPEAEVAPEEREELPEVEEAPEVPLEQQMAVESALDYLDYDGFSKQGLIDQLSSEYGEGFPVETATTAVESLDVDWNAEAVESAISYLDYDAFSRQGLIDQLSSEYGEQFTVKQATFAANEVGL